MSCLLIILNPRTSAGRQKQAKTTSVSEFRLSKRNDAFETLCRAASFTLIVLNYSKEKALVVREFSASFGIFTFR